MASSKDSFELNIIGDGRDVSFYFTAGAAGDDETTVKFKVPMRAVRAALPAALAEVSKRFTPSVAPMSKLALAVDSLSDEQVLKMFTAEGEAFKRMGACLRPDQFVMFMDALQGAAESAHPTATSKPRSSKKTSTKTKTKTKR